MNLLKLTILLSFVLQIFSHGTLPGKFINLGFSALDVAVSSEGDFYLIGTDDRVYYFDFMAGDLIRIDTYGIEGITRIDVDYDGTVYIVSKCGVYSLDCENRWNKLPGGATDIAVRDGEVWKIGDDEINVPHTLTTPESPPHVNYGVWKLICDCKCLCICRRRCIRFRKRDINPCPLPAESDYCYWFRVDGYGINIDILPNGDAIFTVKHDSSSHTTLKTVDKDGNFLRDYECFGKKFSKLANDVTVSNSGAVYVSTTTGDVYKCHEGSEGSSDSREWKRVVLDAYTTQYTNPATPVVCPSGTPALELKADRITSGPYSQLWFNNILKDGSCERTLFNKVFTSAYLQYVKSIPKSFTTALFQGTNVAVKEVAAKAAK
jgi:hypothetical protein